MEVSKSSGVSDDTDDFGSTLGAPVYGSYIMEL